MTTNINKAFIEGILTFGGRGWKLGGGILLGGIFSGGGNE